MDGAVAQLVEQWTENPCVGGSIPPHTTALKTLSVMMGFFVGIVFFKMGLSFDGDASGPPQSTALKTLSVPGYFIIKALPNCIFLGRIMPLFGSWQSINGSKKTDLTPHPRSKISCTKKTFRVQELFFLRSNTWLFRRL